MSKLSMLLDVDFSNYPWLQDIISAVNNILNPILIIACLVGVIYAIWVGITFAKADSADQRKEAKSKLITVIVGIVAALVLVIMFYWLANLIKKGTIKFDQLDDDKTLISPLAAVKSQVMWLKSFF